MDFSLDLTNYTLLNVISLLVALAVIDLVVAVIAAITAGEFNAKFLPLFLLNHVAKIHFPILALAVLGKGVESLGLVALPPAFGLAILGLGAYAVATIKSLADSAAEARKGS